MQTALSPEVSLLYRRIDTITQGMKPWIAKRLKKISEKQALTIVEYVEAMQSEFNPTLKTRINLTTECLNISKFYPDRDFMELSKQDVMFYLNSLRKTEEADPLHKWIGTYNLRLAMLVKLFKWLYYKDRRPEDRPRPLPVENIRRLKRKEESIYTPADMWPAHWDVVFLKYCPRNDIRCFHSMARDTSARPGELLKLTREEVQLQISPNGSWYGQIVGSQKTTQRPLPLIDSIPYIKIQLDEAARITGNNPKAPLFPVTKGPNRGKPMKEDLLYQTYQRLKEEKRYGKRQLRHGGHFPKLLKDPTVPTEDKAVIEEMLKRRWNPYVRRHTALTEKAPILPGPLFNQHSGHSPNSKMPSRYTHFFGAESAKFLLEKKGILPVNGKEQEILKPKSCPNCGQPNAQDAKFCSNNSCKMPLDMEAHLLVMKEKETNEQKMKDLIRQQLEELLLEKYGKKDG